MKYRIKDSVGVSAYLFLITFFLTLITFFMNEKLFPNLSSDGRAIIFYSIFGLCILMGIMIVVEGKLGRKFGSKIYIDGEYIRRGYFFGWKKYKLSHVRDAVIIRRSGYFKKRGKFYPESTLKLLIVYEYYFPVFANIKLTLTDTASEELPLSELEQNGMKELPDEDVPIYQFYKELRASLPKVHRDN